MKLQITSFFKTTENPKTKTTNQSKFVLYTAFIRLFALKYMAHMKYDSKNNGTFEAYSKMHSEFFHQESTGCRINRVLDTYHRKGKKSNNVWLCPDTH